MIKTSIAKKDKITICNCSESGRACLECDCVQESAILLDGDNHPVCIFKDDVCNSQSRESVLSDRSTGRSLLKFAGTWVGDDINECLESVDLPHGVLEPDPDAELIEPVIQGDNNA